MIVLKTHYDLTDVYCLSGHELQANQYTLCSEKEFCFIVCSSIEYDSCVPHALNKQRCIFSRFLCDSEASFATSASCILLRMSGANMFSSFKGHTMMAYLT